MDPGPHELTAVPGVRGLIHLTFSRVSHVPGTALHNTAAGSQGKCLHAPRPGANASTAGRSPRLSQALPTPPASVYEPLPPAHCSPAAPMSLHPSNGGCMLPTKEPTEALPAL